MGHDLKTVDGMADYLIERGQDLGKHEWMDEALKLLHMTRARDVRDEPALSVFRDVLEQVHEQGPEPVKWWANELPGHAEIRAMEPHNTPPGVR